MCIAVQSFWPLLRLFTLYPLLLVTPALLYLLLWNVVLAEYDAFHQLWNEDPLGGLLAGALVATVLGEVVLAVYLLDTDRTERHQKNDPNDREGRCVPWATPVEAYWGAWVILLLLGVVPPLVFCRSEFRPVNGDTRVAALAQLWFPLGVALAAGALGTARALSSALGTRAFEFGRLVLGLFAAAYFLVGLAHWAVPELYVRWIPTPVSVLLLVGFVTGLLGAIAYFAGRTRWLYPALLGLFVVPFVIPSCQVSNRLPHMGVADEPGTSYYDAPVRLADYDRLRTDPAAGLVPDREALDNWHQWMREKYGGPQPLVVVAVSGGATASAVYVADVLFTLEELNPGFADRIRLVCGASGGMLGAAYFVTQLRTGGLIAEARNSDEFREYLAAVAAYRSPKPAADAEDRLRRAVEGYKRRVGEARQQFFARLEQDFLGPLVQKWVHRDIPQSAALWGTTNDRGLALEAAWSRHLAGALDVPFADLRAEERTGRLPSLVLTPMMVEDGRQLVVSNLDLSYMVDTANQPDGPPRSHMGVEFYRLFPRAAEFRLSTAVRMNASFPYLSPSAELPTDPARHVVDAGYYDNYGGAVSIKWVTHNAGWLSEKYVDHVLFGEGYPRVLYLRIRCWGYEQASRRVVTDREVERFAAGRGGDRPPRDPSLRQEWVRGSIEKWKAAPAGPPVRTDGGLFSLTAPLTGLFSSWRANMVYRTDERLSSLQRVLTYRGQEGRVLDLPPDVFTEVSLECQADPSLNWVLTTGDLGSIHEDVRVNLRLPALAESIVRARAVLPEREQDRQALQQAGVELPRPGMGAMEVPSPAEKVSKGREDYGKLPPSAQATINSQARLAEEVGKLNLPTAPVPKK